MDSFTTYALVSLIIHHYRASGHRPSITKHERLEVENKTVLGASASTTTAANTTTATTPTAGAERLPTTTA